jgi:hypothetical protein
MDLPGFPPSIAELYSFLIDSGFEVAKEAHGGMAGSRRLLAGVVSTISGPVDVRFEIISDRGQWSVSFKLDDMVKPIIPAVWEACLDREELRDPDLVEQVSFVRSRLEEAASAFKARPDIEIELVRIGESYMRKRLGLGSSGEP